MMSIKPVGVTLNITLYAVSETYKIPWLFIATPAMVRVDIVMKVVTLPIHKKIQI